MGVLEKQLLLEELSRKLEIFLPAPEVHRAIAAAGETLAAYTVESIAPGDEDDSDGLIRLFLEAKASEGKSQKTIYEYRRTLDRLHEVMPVPLSKVTVYHLRGFISSEMQRGCKASTVATYRSVFCSFYGWLTLEGLIERNPCNNLSPVKAPKEVRKPFSREDILKLLDALKDQPRDAALVQFMLASGCRVSEVCSVDREDLDLERRKLTVMGKGSKERTVFLDDDACYRLSLYLESRTDDSPALFPGRCTDRLQPPAVRRMLHKAADRAGVEDCHPHRFRRTLATGLIDGGMAVQDVAKVLGHSKLDTTMEYVYQSASGVEAAYRRAI